MLTNRFQKGFTLIELLVAISIITVLSAVIYTSAVQIQRSGRDTQRRTDLEKLKQALEQYSIDQGFYPFEFVLSSATELTNATGNPTTPATERKYLTTVPKNPTSGTAYCYTAYSNRTKTISCDNVSNRCHYYSLYAKLESDNSESTGLGSCSSGKYNLEINPN